MLIVGTAAMTASYAWLSTIGTGDTYLGGVFGPMLLNGLVDRLWRSCRSPRSC